MEILIFIVLIAGFIVAARTGYLYLNRLVKEEDTAEVIRLREMEVRMSCNCDDHCNEYCHATKSKEETLKAPELWIGH